MIIYLLECDVCTYGNHALQWISKNTIGVDQVAIIIVRRTDFRITNLHFVDSEEIISIDIYTELLDTNLLSDTLWYSIANSIDFKRRKAALRNHQSEAAPFQVSPYVCLIKAFGHRAFIFSSAVLSARQRPS